jgi:hypothetical protein
MNWLMLIRENIDVCYENLTEFINMLCVENAELLIDKAGGTNSYHWTFKG